MKQNTNNIPTIRFLPNTCARCVTPNVHSTRNQFYDSYDQVGYSANSAYNTNCFLPEIDSDDRSEFSTGDISDSSIAENSHSLPTSQKDNPDYLHQKCRINRNGYADAYLNAMETLCSMQIKSPEVFVNAAINHAIESNILTPEVIIGESCSFGTDASSFGKILYEICSLIVAHDVIRYYGSRQVFDRIAIEGGLQTELKKIAFHATKKLIKDCWHGDPTQRPSFQDIRRSICDIVACESEELSLKKCIKRCVRQVNLSSPMKKRLYRYTYQSKHEKSIKKRRLQSKHAKPQKKR